MTYTLEPGFTMYGAPRPYVLPYWNITTSTPSISKTAYLTAEPFEGKGRITGFHFYLEYRNTDLRGSVKSSIVNKLDSLRYRYHYKDGSIDQGYKNPVLLQNLLYIPVPENVKEVETIQVNSTSGGNWYRTYTQIRKIDHTIADLNWLDVGTDTYNPLTRKAILLGSIPEPIDVAYYIESSYMDSSYHSLSYSLNNGVSYIDADGTIQYPGYAHYFRAEIAANVDKDEAARVILVYTIPNASKEATSYEATVTTSVKKIAADNNIRPSVTSDVIVKRITSQSAVEVQKSSYSHVEPLQTTTTKNALVVTSTKGGRIGTVVFTNVKAATSSLISPIDSCSRSELSRRRISTVNSFAGLIDSFSHLGRYRTLSVTSFMKDVHTGSQRASSAVLLANSRANAIQSVSETIKTWHAHLDSQVGHIQSRASGRPIRLELRALPVNKTLYSGHYKSVVFHTTGTGYLQFSTYLGMSGTPAEMNFLLSLDSDAYSSDKAHVWVYFFDVNRKIISYGGLTITSPGKHTDVPYRAVVPENADTFYVERRMRSRGLGEHCTAKADLVDMTYLVVPELEPHEVIVATSSASFATTAHHELETKVYSFSRHIGSQSVREKSEVVSIISSVTDITASAISKATATRQANTHVFAAESTSEATKTKQTVVDSHAKPSESSIIEENSSNCIATSFVMPIRSTSEASRSKQVGFASNVLAIYSRVAATASKEILTTSHMHSSYAETLIEKEKAFVLTSIVSPITTNVFASGDHTYESFVSSGVMPIRSKIVVSRKETFINNSFTEKVGTHAVSSSASKRISIVTSTVRKITTDTLRASEIVSASFVKAAATEVTIKVQTLPKEQEVVVASSVNPIIIHSTIGKKIILQSYIKQSFSKTLLSPYRASVTSIVSNITSGVAVERSTIAFIVTVDSYVRPIRHDILEERRKLRMRLNELKIRLRIPADDTVNDDYLLVVLEDALDFIQRTCNQQFDPLPPTAKKVASQYVENELAGGRHIKAEWIADMKQEFESTNDRDKALTDMLRKAGLVRLRWGG
ncbi:hypothetical protein [Sporosarcina sp. P17b]|uniref:hypothetical protein n=1 Tax=Sporosarcina sp. P17b TaxID=2048260 RepID=UPI000C17301D|nr:hypothetical protein [Sporosarcina sp. P17b]PIC73337.1 hypothetical protein CSV76_11000 [Sporosarcina sp. P17b]